MVNSYVLVNPYIEGSFEKTVKAKNSIEAGKILYTSLSEHFNNNVPKFLFTIQKGTSGKGKHYSFKVKEKKDQEDNEINFSIEPYNVKNEEIAYKGLQEKISEFRDKILFQEGGAKKAAKGKKKASKKAPKKSSKKAPKKKSTKKQDNFDEDLFDDDMYDYELKDVYDDDFDDSPKHNVKRVQRFVPTSSAPIYHWFYDPHLYRLNSVFVPTFYSYVTPYIELSLR